MTKRVTFLIEDCQFVQCHKNGYLYWGEALVGSCTDDEFAQEYYRFIDIASWCVRWGKKIELEEIRRFVNYFHGYFAPKSYFKLEIAPFSRTPRVNPQIEYQREVFLNKALKRVLQSPSMDTVNELVASALPIIRKI